MIGRTTIIWRPCRNLPDETGANHAVGSMCDISWDRVQMHVNGWGGHYVNPDDPRRCEMAASPALEAMEWLRARLWMRK